MGIRKLRWKISRALISKDEQKFFSGIYASVDRYKMVDKSDTIGRVAYIRIEVEEIRGGHALCRNKYGYYYTVSLDEIAKQPTARWIKDGRKHKCEECGCKVKQPTTFCPDCGTVMK